MDNDPTKQSSVGTTIWTDQINAMCETYVYNISKIQHYGNCIRHSMGVRNYHKALPSTHLGSVAPNANRIKKRKAASYGAFNH